MRRRRPIRQLAFGTLALAGVAFVAAFLLASTRPASTGMSSRSATAAPAAREAVERRAQPALGRAAALPAMRVERVAPPRRAPAPPAPAVAASASPSPPPAAPVATAAPAPPPPAPTPAPVADAPTATPAPTFDSTGEPFDSSG